MIFFLLLFFSLVLLPSRTQSSNLSKDEQVALEQNLAKAAKLLKTGRSSNATARIAGSLGKSQEIFVSVTVRNLLNVPLVQGSGSCHGSYGLLHPRTPVPRSVLPGTQEAFLTLQAGNTRGTSGTASWTLEGTAGVKVDVMWSVPYNLRFHGSYVAAGVSKASNRTANQMFLEMYANKSDWFQLVSAGNQPAVHKSNLTDLVVIGQMAPKNSYRPQVTFTVTSLNPDLNFWTAANVRSVPPVSSDPQSRAARSTSAFWIFILVVSSISISALLLRLFCCLFKGDDVDAGMDDQRRHNGTKAFVTEGEEDRLTQPYEGEYLRGDENHNTDEV